MEQNAFTEIRFCITWEGVGVIFSPFLPSQVFNGFTNTRIPFESILAYGIVKS